MHPSVRLPLRSQIWGLRAMPKDFSSVTHRLDDVIKNAGRNSV